MKKIIFYEKNRDFQSVSLVPLRQFFSYLGQFHLFSMFVCFFYGYTFLSAIQLPLQFSASFTDFASGDQGAFLKNRPLDPQKTFY